MSDDPQPADWAITVFPGARQTPARSYQTESVPQTRLDQFTAWNQNVAGKDELAAGSTPVAGSAVNGTVSTNSVGIAPASSVAVKDTNMLVSQDFSSSRTVAVPVGGNWSWYGDDGRLRLGCARVDCTGIQDDLVSNEILVVPNENVRVTVWVKWADLSYTGTHPIVLGVEKYRKGKDPDSGGTVYLDVGGTDIASLMSPASSGDWTKLTGTYVVPAKGVDQLRFRFRAAPAITFGFVLWDEAEFKKLDLIPDAAVPGVGTTVDNIVTNLYGGISTGYSHADEATALASTAQAITTNSSNVSQIQAAASTGTIAGDDFSYTGNVLSNSWGGTNFYTTSWAGDGNNAAFQTASGVPGNVLLPSRYDWQGAGATSSTDYQKIEIVLSRGNENGTNVSLFGRISSDWTSFIGLTISPGAYLLFCSAFGVVTTLASGACSSPGAGATITLYCGDLATTAPRQFTAQINGSTIVSYTDTSTTNYGASYRKWGWGGAGQFLSGVPIWVKPATINQWTGVDQ